MRTSRTARRVGYRRPRREGAFVRRHRTAGPAAIVAAGVMWLGLAVAVSPTTASAGTPVPGAPNCPMFPADNVWNTPIAGLPVNPNSTAWMSSMDAPRRTSTPTSGPRATPPTPTACPTPWCPRHSPSPHHLPVRRRERPGPYPFSADRRSRAAAVHRRPPRHHGQPGDLHPLRALRRAVQRVGLDRRFGRHLEPQLERPAPGRMDVGRRGRPARSCPGSLRYDEVQSGAITHAIRMTAETTDTSYLWPARHEAGLVQPQPAAHGSPLPAQGQLQHLGLLAPGTGGPACHAAVRPDPGRQRIELVLRGDGGPSWPTALVNELKRSRPAPSRRSTSRR